MKKFILFAFIFIYLFMLQCSMKALAEDILIIFDASVSMMDTFNDEPKYIKAISEIKKVLNVIPNDNNVGLRMIGITNNSNILAIVSNPNLMCKATDLVIPINKNNNDKISIYLDSIFPLGTTPLTYSLKMAIENDFKNSNSIKHIILITDGGENCNENPCKYITELMKSRQDIVIDIIAIRVDDNDYKELKCISDNTSGTTININKPDEISSAMKKFFSANNIKKNNKQKNTDIIYKNYIFEFYENDT